MSGLVNSEAAEPVAEHAGGRTKGRKRWPRVVCATSIGALALVGWSVAAASIPDANGTVHACYNVSAPLLPKGNVRIIDGSQHCASYERSISWNQVGPPGVAGPQGPVGPKGDTGAMGPAGPGANQFGHNTQQAAAGTGAQCTIGQVILSAGSVANGIPANGQLLLINDEPTLFTLLGTTYGGDGQTTFALPNLASAAPNGLTYSICARGIYPSRN
jgi:hypothetical protein